MNRRIIMLILSMVTIFLSFGCERERELYSREYNASLSELDTLNCEEYEKTAVCEVYAFLFNIGHFNSSYSNGKVTIETTLGNLYRTIPIRCNLDTLLSELIKIDNEKGMLGRFGESFTLAGTRYIKCE